MLDLPNLAPSPVREAYRIAERILTQCEALEAIALFQRPQDADRFARTYNELAEILYPEDECLSGVRAALDNADPELCRFGPVMFDGSWHACAHRAVWHTAKRIIHQGAADDNGTVHICRKLTATAVPGVLTRIVFPDLDELRVALKCEAARAGALAAPALPVSAPAPKRRGGRPTLQEKNPALFALYTAVVAALDAAAGIRPDALASLKSDRQAVGLAANANEKLTHDLLERAADWSRRRKNSS